MNKQKLIEIVERWKGLRISDEINTEALDTILTILKAEPTTPKRPTLDQCQIAVKVVDMGEGLFCCHIFKASKEIIREIGDCEIYDKNGKHILINNLKQAVKQPEVKQNCLSCTIDKRACSNFRNALGVEKIDFDCSFYTAKVSNFTEMIEIKNGDITYFFFGVEDENM